MIRWAVVALLIVTAALLQTAVFPYLTLAGFRPDLLLLVVAALALHDGPLTGTAVGFAAGMLSDLLLVQPPVGLSAVVYLAVGYAVGVARPYLAAGSVTVPLTVAFGATFLGTATYGLLSALLGEVGYTPLLVLEAAAVIALYNTLLAPLVFAAVSRLSARFPGRPSEV